MPRIALVHGARQALNRLGELLNSSVIRSFALEKPLWFTAKRKPPEQSPLFGDFPIRGPVAIKYSTRHGIYLRGKPTIRISGRWRLGFRA